MENIVTIIAIIISAVIGPSIVLIVKDLLEKRKEDKIDLNEEFTQIKDRLDEYNERAVIRDKLLYGISMNAVVDYANHMLKRSHIITDSEYENFEEHLYKPYRELGGNGIAEIKYEKVKEKYLKQKREEDEEGEIKHGKF